MPAYGFCDFCRNWTYRDLTHGACGDCLARWAEFPETMPVPMRALLAAPAPAAPAPAFKVTRPTGEVIYPGALVFDLADNTPYTLLRATRATVPGKSGRIVVRRNGQETERFAGAFGLRVSIVVPQHDDPVTRAWCRFSGTNSLTGECPVHPGPEAA